MFKEELFDKQTRIFPHKGMNVDASGSVLKPENGIYIENFLPLPAGEGQVRFGTRTIKDAFFDQTTKTQMVSMFPAFSTSGEKQIICYARDFIQETDDNVAFKKNDDDNLIVGISIPLARKEHYQKDFSVIVSYRSDAGDEEETLTISSVEDADNYIIKFDDYSFPPESGSLSLKYPSGSLYLYDFSTVSKIKEGLHPHCLPYYLYFKMNTFICNGYNKVMRWDGEALFDVQGWVEETTADIQKINNTSLKFKKGFLFDINNFTGKTIRLTPTNKVSVELTVLNAAINGDIGTLTFDPKVVLPNFDKNGAKISYLKDVPKFSWMRELHGRIFALGEGLSGIKYRNPSESMKVYFQYHRNSLDEWFSPTTKGVPFIDISTYHGVVDNLEAISFTNGQTLFMGRKKTQVWRGTEPIGASVDPDAPPLQYVSSINIGLVHRSLFRELPNQTWVVSETGIVELSRLGNIVGEFQAGNLTGMNSYVKDTLPEMLKTKKGWDSTSSAFYPQGNFFLFRIGTSKPIVAVTDGSVKAFSVFSGDFQWSSCYMDSLNNSLYLFRENCLYQYGDDATGVPAYGDKGGKELIPFVWCLSPFLGRRWANRYFKIDMEFPSSFLLRENNMIALSVSGDLPQSFNLDSSYSVSMKGDIVETVPLLAHSIYNDDNPEVTEEGQRFDIPYSMTFERLCFVSSKFFVTIYGYTNSGVISLKQIDLFGIYGRKS